MSNVVNLMLLPLAAEPISCPIVELAFSLFRALRASTFAGRAAEVQTTVTILTGSIAAVSAAYSTIECDVRSNLLITSAKVIATDFLTLTTWPRVWR